MSTVPTPPPYSVLFRRIIAGLFITALLVNLWAVTRGWNSSLRDGHEFRQNQTALTAYYFKKEGLRIDYETPVLGPPWSIPMEFPLYQAVVAKLSRYSGLPLEQAGRLTGIFFFYATLPALWLLLRRRLSDVSERLVAIIPTLVCPVLMFYSRTFMIESTALCLTVWFLVAFEKILDRPRSGNMMAVCVLGSLAALTKVTTFAATWIFLAALVIERILIRRRSGQGWTRATFSTLGLALLAGSMPLALGTAWVIHSDHLKEIHPYARVLTSAALRPFNLGTIAQRLSYDWWRQIGHISFSQVIGWPGLFLLLGGACVVAAPYRRLALACTAGFTGGFLLFANLYYVHDYYFYASAMFLLTAVGIISAGLLRVRWLPRGFALLLVVGGCVGEVEAFRETYYSFYRRENDPVPFEAEIIRRLTPPEDVFAGFGYDWSSLLPYHSERRGLMPFLGDSKDFSRLDRSLSQLGTRHLNTVIVTGYLRREYPFIGTLKDRLQLTDEPVVTTADADIYVSRDRAAAVAKILSARSDWGGAQLNPQPDVSLAMPLQYYDLHAANWTGRFPMTSPAPFLSKGPVEIGILMLDDKLAISTQAPTEIHFHPPAGSRSITAIGGMVPGSYTEGHTTPGVVLTVYEEMTDGSRHMIFKRMLTPLTEPKDRGDIVISYEQETPFTGTLVFGHNAIPSGNVNYSWSYWKQITIR